MSERVIVDKLPDKLPWVDGIDYSVVSGNPAYGNNIRVRDATGESFMVYTDPGPTPVPKPNNANNPYFGKTPLETKNFFALAGQVLGANYPRLRNDPAFLWVYDVLTKVDIVDVDDKGGQFLAIVHYLTNTNASDSQPLMSTADLASIMAAWP